MVKAKTSSNTKFYKFEMIFLNDHPLSYIDFPPFFIIKPCKINFKNGNLIRVRGGGIFYLIKSNRIGN